MANRHKQAAYAAEPPVPKKARYSRYPTEQKSADLIALAHRRCSSSLAPGHSV